MYVFILLLHGFFSGCGDWGCSLGAVHWLLIVVACLLWSMSSRVHKV